MSSYYYHPDFTTQDGALSSYCPFITTLPALLRQGGSVSEQMEYEPDGWLCRFIVSVTLPKRTRQTSMGGRLMDERPLVSQ